MGRAPCCEKVGLKKGKWTAEEDEILTKYIQGNGEGSWRSLPKNAGLLRCGKSCRLRWVNYLKTDLKRGNITTEEEELVIKLHASFGKRWSLIASHLPGRTDNELKNHWNTHLIKKIHTFQGQAGHETLPAMAEVASVSVSTKKKSDKTRKCSMKKNKSKNNKHGNVSTQQRPDKNVSTEEEIQLPATPTQEKETFPSTSIEGCMDLDPLEEEDKNIIINQIISSPCQVISFGEETTINNSMLCPGGEEKHTQTLVPIFEDEILCFNDIMGSTVWTLLDETENCVKNISEEKEIAGMEMRTSSMANISEKIESANNLIKTNGESVACSSITSFFDDDSFDWDWESAIQGHHYQQCDDNEENHLPSLW